MLGNHNNIHDSVTLLSRCISKLLIFPTSWTSEIKIVWLYHILGKNGGGCLYHCKKYTCYSLWILCCIAIGCRIWFVSLTVIKGILKILFHIWGSALMKFGHCSVHFLTLIGICFSELMICRYIYFYMWLWYLFLYCYLF